MIFSMVLGALTGTKLYLAMGGGALLAVLLIVTAVFFIGKRAGQKKKESLEDKTYVEDGVKYTYSDKTQKADGGTRVSLSEKDMILVANKTYRAEKGGYLMPGRYTVLTAGENSDSFNIRLGLFVREYKHGDSIAIGDGEEVTAVSSTVILR